MLTHSAENALTRHLLGYTVILGVFPLHLELQKNSYIAKKPVMEKNPLKYG